MPRFIHYPPAGLSGYIHTLNKGTALMARCRTCGVETPQTIEKLELYQQGMDTLTDIAERLRCPCGARNAELLPGYYVEEGTNG